MVVNRVSNSEKQAKTFNDIESKFIAGVERNNLESLSLDELANRFEEIEQQGQLYQGQILLAARNKFKQDVEFGRWCSQSLCLTSQPHRTRLMNLARFFDETKHPLEKISVTAAYEISAPINADVADEIYKAVRGKNIPVAEVKRQIALKKGVKNTSIIPTSVEPVVEKISVSVFEISPSQTVTNSIITDTTPTIPKPAATDIMPTTPKAATEISETETDLKSQFMALAKTVSPQVAIVALQACIQELNAIRYPSK
jgi:hypothetical protein